eukprot:TRINITY_DN2110_c0_g4_i1.p1 TRINITY_DN2110_c0_g4~~TRINITY_DN2110_c0_g4_i1.p1  ORF type:complete len:930 (-),score=285.35 TRINITY_DN2110_c0_g4_i1:226-3015(-)
MHRKKSSDQRPGMQNAGSIKMSRGFSSIDTLVRQSIKKLREQQQTEIMKRQEQMEKEKQSKEFLGYRNKAIREMNAKSWSWSRLTQDSTYKYGRPDSKANCQKRSPGKSIKKEVTEMDRQSKLGLKFIELCRKLAIAKGTSGKKLKLTKPESKAKKDSIVRKYTVSKRREERKTKGKAKLKRVVNKMLKKDNRKSTPERLGHKKKNRSEFFLKSGENESMLKSVKQSILHEMDDDYFEQHEKHSAESAQLFVLPPANIKTINAIKIQRAYREHLVKKKQPKVSNKRKDNTRINPVALTEEQKSTTAKKEELKSIAVQSEELFILPDYSKEQQKPETRTVETQTAKESESARKSKYVKAVEEDKKVHEMRLLIGSEKFLKDNTETPLLLHNDSEVSLFDRNPFQEFTQRKIKELIYTDRLSKLISMREKVMKYKEATEKKFIKKMLKSKEFSPRTYQRKRRDLEKWVNKEREEIKETKRSVSETWKHTAHIIEEAQRDSMNLKKLLETHALSYNSESNSIFSILLDSSRSLESSDKRTLVDFNNPALWKRERSLDSLSDVVQDEELLLMTSGKERLKRFNEPILIQDESVVEGEVKGLVETPVVKDADSERDAATTVVKDSSAENLPRKNHAVLNIPDEEFSPLVEESKDICINLVSKVKADDKAEAITSEVYEAVIMEALSSLFPRRQTVPAKESEHRQSVMLREIGKDRGVRSRMIQSLAYDPHRGISLDSVSIGRYLDSVFALMISRHSGSFIREVNSSIAKSNLEIMNTLRGDRNSRIQAKLPHEIQPIIPLSIYLDIDKSKVSTFKNPNPKVNLKECEQIHNKAVFDAVNEALNLIRPYGLNGEPLPWSLQQRILFKSITDPNIITRNIKNMILDWVSFEVGTLPKANFLINGRFDEEYFAEIRERHLINMLAQEVRLSIKIDNR